MAKTKQKSKQTAMDRETLLKMGSTNRRNNNGFTVVIAQPDGIHIYMSNAGLGELVGVYSEEKAAELLASYDRCIALPIMRCDIFSGIYSLRTDTKDMHKKLEQEVVLTRALALLKERQVEVA